MKKSLLISTLLFGISSAAQAATFNFDVTWDGASLTETSAGSGLTTTTLENNDDFSLTIRAAGNGYWTSLSGASGFLPLNPLADGSTTGDVTATLSNDGSTVFTDAAIESRCCAELGFRQWESIAIGTVFDMIVMDYKLISGGPQTIFFNGTSITSFWLPDASGSIFTSPFLTESYNYTDVPAAVVPLPAGGLLLLTAIGGLAFTRRRWA